MNKEFNRIKNMSREDLEYAYYGAKAKYKDYQQALNEIRNYILELDDETDNSIYDIESGTRNEILDRIDKVQGDDEK